jgi:hypothetical protein
MMKIREKGKGKREKVESTFYFLSFGPSQDMLVTFYFLSRQHGH